MKNKEKYDLTKLTVRSFYMVDGCGRKIDGKSRVDIEYDGELVASRQTKENVIDCVFKWLEEEA